MKRFILFSILIIFNSCVTSDNSPLSTLPSNSNSSNGTGPSSNSSENSDNSNSSNQTSGPASIYGSSMTTTQTTVNSTGMIIKTILVTLKTSTSKNFQLSPSLTTSSTSSSPSSPSSSSSLTSVAAGKIISLSSSRGNLDNISPRVALTNESGQAVFTISSYTFGNAKLSVNDAASGDMLLTSAFNFTIPTADSTQSQMSTNATTLASDGVSAATITVTIKDSLGNTLGGKKVALYSSRGSLDSIHSISETTSDSGIAVFSVSSINFGTATFSAVDITDKVPVAKSITVSFVFPRADAFNSTIAITPNNLSAIAFLPLKAVVILKDNQGRPAAGKLVSLMSPGFIGSGLNDPSGLTDSNGEVYFNITTMVAGTFTFSAIDLTDNVLLNSTASVTILPGPVSISTSTATITPASNIPADNNTTATIAITLRDSVGNKIAGKNVSLSSPGFAGTISAPSGPSDANGTVTFSVKSSIQAVVNFFPNDDSDSIPLNPVTVKFISPPTNSNRSLLSAAPISLTANGVVTSTISVTLKDALNRAVSDSKVALYATPNFVTEGGSIAPNPADATSLVNGIVTFDIKTTTAKKYVFLATATDITNIPVLLAPTAEVTFNPGSVDVNTSTVTVSGNSEVVANGVASLTIVVSLKDAFSNLVPGKNVSLQFSSGGPGTITQISNTNGVATFKVVSTNVGDVTFSATDTTDNKILTQMVSGKFLAQTVDANKSTITASPATVLANNTATSTITVTLKDVNNNIVPGRTVSITSSPGFVGNISPTGAGSNISNSMGIATFFVKATSLGTYTFTAKNTTDNPNVTIAGNAIISFTSGGLDANTSTVVPTSNSVPADGTTATTVTVTAKDTFGNPITGQAFTLTSSNSEDNITTTSSGSNISNASGVATFYVKSSRTSFPGTPSIFTAKAGNITLTSTANITFTSTVNANNSLVSSPDNPIILLNTISSFQPATFKITLLNSSNIPVPGKTITLSSSRGAGIDTITPAAGAVSDANGAATFTVSSNISGISTYTAVADNGAVTLSKTVSVTSKKISEICSPVTNKCNISENLYSQLAQIPFALYDKIIAPSTGDNAPRFSKVLNRSTSSSLNKGLTAATLMAAGEIGNDLNYIDDYLKRYPHEASRIKHLLTSIKEWDTHLVPKQKANSNSKFKNNKLMHGPVMLHGKYIVMKSLIEQMKHMDSKTNNIKVHQVLRKIWEKKLGKNVRVLDKNSGEYLFPYLDKDLYSLSNQEIRKLNLRISDYMAFETKSSSSTCSSSADPDRIPPICNPNSPTNNVIGEASAGNRLDVKQTTDVYRTIDPNINSYVAMCDFKLRNALTCVKNQGSRGTCVAFSTVATVETKLRYDTGKNVNLSEQALYHIIKAKWDKLPPNGAANQDGYWLGKSIPNSANDAFLFPVENQWSYNPASCLSSTRGGTDFSNACYITCSCATVGSTTTCTPGNSYLGHCSNSPSEGEYVCDDKGHCGYLSQIDNKTQGAVITSYMALDVGRLNNTDPVPWSSISQIINFLESGYPVAISMLINSDFLYWDYLPIAVIDYTTQDSKGGHAVSLVGYIPITKNNGDGAYYTTSGNLGPISGLDNNQSYNGIFIIKNSWGHYSGDAGYYYVTDRFLRYTLSEVVAVQGVGAYNL